MTRTVFTLEFTTNKFELPGSIAIPRGLLKIGPEKTVVVWRDWEFQNLMELLPESEIQSEPKQSGWKSAFVQGK